MKIYIGAKIEARESIRPYRDALWALGHQVVSSWLDEVKKPEGMSDGEFLRKLAIKDVAEIQSADLVIIQTIKSSDGGGREVEFGVALGQFQNKLIFIVGPRQNAFHYLADRRFDTWDELMDYFKPNKEVEHGS